METITIKCAACEAQKDIKVRGKERIPVIRLTCGECHRPLSYSDKYDKDNNMYIFKPVINYLRSSGYTTTHTPY